MYCVWKICRMVVASMWFIRGMGGKVPRKSILMAEERYL